ncbi:MAG: hypothetical protein MUC89_23805 [Acetobacteraceae bacterium]|jgi:hypothetical protein|nr:hypothetical protein [Acetobacteraceae bacterium]
MQTRTKPIFSSEQHKKAETDPLLKELMGDYLMLIKAQDDQERFSPEQRKDFRVARVMTAGSLAHRYGIRVE